MFHHRIQNTSYFHLILGGGILDAGRGMLLPLPCDTTLVAPVLPPRDLTTGGLSPDMPRPCPPRADSAGFPTV